MSQTKKFPAPPTLEKYARQAERAAHAIEDEVWRDMPHPEDLRAGALVLRNLAYVGVPLSLTEEEREALKFYADERTYTKQNPTNSGLHGSGADIWRDLGKHARDALSSGREERDG